MESKYSRRDLDEKYVDVLRTAKETEAIAAATCESLRNQTDTIDRISDKSYEVSANIDKSEKIVRGMGGFFGKIKNLFSRNKPTDVKPNKSVKEETNFKVDRGKESEKVYGVEDSKKNSDEYFIEQLTYTANNLKSMAVGISSTLDEHNEKLDRIGSLTEKNNDRIERLNYKAKKLMN